MSRQSGENAIITEVTAREPLETAGQAAIEAVGLSRAFGALTAVDDVDLTIRSGELFSLLGPVSPQETAIAERLTARENLRLMAGLHGVDRAGARARSDELLQMMALTDRADDRVRTYSGAQATVVEAEQLTDAAVAALELLYPVVRRVEGGVVPCCW